MTVSTMEGFERSVYLEVQHRGHHNLAYRDYLRARELGIDLPEATPTYHDYAGDYANFLIRPEKWPQATTHGSNAPNYRVAEDGLLTRRDRVNIGLLAAIGKIKSPFSPAGISPMHDGYSWAQIPQIIAAKLTIGKTLASGDYDEPPVICVDRLAMSLQCNDGTEFRAELCVALGLDWERDLGHTMMYVTPAAKKLIRPRALFGCYADFVTTGRNYDDAKSEVAAAALTLWASASEQGRRRLTGKRRRP